MTIVRFAPSLSGYLHIGSIRTVLYNWLYARQNNGKFILRIEDTDEDEIDPRAEDIINRTLKWLGLGWEEYYRQSDRYKQGVYDPHIKKLLSIGLAYPCFCSQEILRQERVAMREGGEPPKYKGTCRNLSEAERQRNLEEKKPYVYRFAVPKNGETCFEDLIQRHGKQFRFSNENIGDFVITRPNSEKNQVPTFLLTNTIDDFEMGITHVIRGDEHISNTPRQIMLQKALGLKAPIYAHLPTVLDPDRVNKLSKSRGALSILEYKRQGYLPDALLNYVMLLGWTPEDRSGTMNLDDMQEQFKLENVSTRKGSFDKRQLLSLNAKHIAKLANDKLGKLIQEYVEINGSKFDRANDLDYVKVASVCKSRIRILSDLNFLFQTQLSYQQEIIDLLKKSSPHILETVLFYIEKLTYFSPDNIETAIWQARDEVGIERRDLAELIRLTMTGSKVSPGLFGL